MYEIEQQEYINKRIIALVNSINEHLISIRNFIIEQKLARDQNNEIYMHENFTVRENLLKNSTELLKARNNALEPIQRWRWRNSKSYMLR